MCTIYSRGCLVEEISLASSAAYDRDRPVGMDEIPDNFLKTAEFTNERLVATKA